MQREALRKGINLGGWISQFKENNPDHFDTFITEEDISRIKNWGFDHIRLPVDYIVLEDVENPGTYLQSGFDIINKCLGWCDRANLRVILDLHKAPGYAFDEQDRNDFETHPHNQERFIHLWREIARQFAHINRDLLSYELLNEIVFDDYRKWNEILQRTLADIRRIDIDRLVLFGGNYYSAVYTLSELPNLRDRNILPKFHFYLPLSITHQKAYWVPGLMHFDREARYPGKVSGLGAFLEEHPQYAGRLKEEVDVNFNAAYLREMLTPAVDFMDERDTFLHCGEFGVIDRAPMQTRLNWTRDMVRILREMGIGYAYWTYKELDFGLVDIQGKVVNQELIDILTA